MPKIPKKLIETVEEVASKAKGGAAEAEKILAGIKTAEEAVALKGPEREAYLKALDEVHGPKEQRAAEVMGGKEYKDMLAAHKKADTKAAKNKTTAYGGDEVDYTGADEGQTEQFLAKHPDLRPRQFGAAAMPMTMPKEYDPAEVAKSAYDAYDSYVQQPVSKASEYIVNKLIDAQSPDKESAQRLKDSGAAGATKMILEGIADPTNLLAAPLAGGLKLSKRFRQSKEGQAILQKIAKGAAGEGIMFAPGMAQDSKFGVKEIISNQINAQEAVKAAEATQKQVLETAKNAVRVDDLHTAAALPTTGLIKPTDVITHANVPASDFHAALSQSRNADKRIEQYTHLYTPEEYAQMKTFLAPDKKSGFSVKGDGDIVSAFNAERGGGRLRSIMETAKAHGGKKLDAFDKRAGEAKGLPDLYSQYGFKETKREKNWVPGEPDVVYMELPEAAPKKP